MKITVIGTGYVGLVTGTCLAEMGNDVTCTDVDCRKIDMLSAGEVPIYEPGLSELINRNAAGRRLHFTTEARDAAGASELVFIAVGTPSDGDGSANVSNVDRVVDELAGALAADAIVVIKSTVPVGTNRNVYERLRELTGRRCRVASNPEFLKEGAAIDDFMKPDRVVAGVREGETAEVLRDLFAPYLRTENPFLVMSPESAEMTKYVANALLATKISFINEMANYCEQLEADVNEVRRGIGHDKRIGFAFLFPGVGYGGSCFPKDVRALMAIGRDCGVEPRLLSAVDDVNHRQKRKLIEKIERHFGGDVAGRTIAIWGLAFKPHTDDVREAPALVLIDWLLEQGTALRVHDPVATANVEALYGDRLVYGADAYEALEGAEALAINTEWEQFRRPDFERMRSAMKSAVIFDGRNLYEPEAMRGAGFTYYSIGRPAVVAE